jgi:hypothetical protein
LCRFIASAHREIQQAQRDAARDGVGAVPHVELAMDYLDVVFAASSGTAWHL